MTIGSTYPKLEESRSQAQGALPVAIRIAIHGGQAGQGLVGGTAAGKGL